MKRLVAIIALFYSVFAYTQTKELVIKINEDAPEGLSVAVIQKFRGFQEVDRIHEKSSEKALANEKSILDGVFRIKIEEGQDLQELCDSILGFENVIYAEPIHEEQLLVVPNDPDAQVGGNQSYLQIIKAYEAWGISTGDPSIVLGIIDSGSDLDHIDLSSNYFVNTSDPINGLDDDNNGYIDDYSGYDFADADSNPEADTDGHGTQVVGVAGAVPENGIGMAGVAYNTSISPMKIFRSGSNTSNNAYSAIMYAADNGYEVINLSWGSINSYSSFNQDIINYAVLEKDVVIVAAAGNTPSDLAFYPASYDNVLSVTSTNNDDTKSSFATYHKHVDISAPGTSTYSTFNGNTYGNESGTSFSSPMVAGVAALVRDVYPDLTAQQVMERIRVTADDIQGVGTNSNYKGKIGFGRLNALKALSESSVTSLRTTDISMSGSNEGFFFGDTINISGTITNYLDPVVQPSLHSEILSGNAEVYSDEIGLNFMNTLTTQDFSNLRIIVSDQASPGEKVELLLTYTADGYEDFQLFDLTLNPDYFDFGNDLLKLTVAGNGNLGYATNTQQDGLGLEWGGSKILDDIGLIVTVDSLTEDNILNHYENKSRDQDFTATRSIRPYPYQGADYSYNEFADINGNLKIEQSTLLWDDAPDDVLMVEYRITNLNSDTLFDTHVGLFGDFNLEGTANKATWDEEKTTFAINEEEDLFAGIRVLGSTQQAFSSRLDLTLYTQETNTINDSTKRAWTSEVLPDSIGFSALTNVAIMQGQEIDTLAPNTSVSVVFLISAAESYSLLDSKLDQAELRYAEYQENPFTEEILYSCVGGSLSINPSSGSNFYFFSDPYGTDTLAHSSSLDAGPFDKDTVYYVSNSDHDYGGPIRAIRVRLSEDFADFEMPETFYIDQNNKRLTLLDKSTAPVSWEWDFGNGSGASGIQNPKATFTEAGNYNVKLTVETEEGCVDSETRVLEVISGISPPTFGKVYACKDPNLKISSSGNDFLKHYFNSEANLPITEGTEISIASVTRDTTLFFSRVVNGIESPITSVNALFIEPKESFTVNALTDSLNSSYGIAIPVETSAASVSWTFDGTNAGSEASLTFPITKSSAQIGMTLTTKEGCVLTSEETVNFAKSSSPVAKNYKVCFESDLEIAPEAGKIFAFYADSIGTDILHKGESYTLKSLKSDTAVYVAGLDKLLPGDPVRFEIDVREFIFSVESDPEKLYLNDRPSAKFNVTNTSGTYKWFVEDNPMGIGMHQTYFFDSASTYEIRVLGTNELNCTFQDTIQFEVALEPTILSTKNQDSFSVYPIPASTVLYIDGHEEIQSAKMYNSSGAAFLIERVRNEFAIRHLSPGVYQLEVTLKNGEIVRRSMIIAGE